MKALTLIILALAVLVWIRHSNRQQESPVNFWYEEETAERDGERVTVTRWGVD